MELEPDTYSNSAGNRNDLLLLALKLFAEKGYFNTTLTDIKEAAEFKTTQSIFQYFKSKQAIAQELHNSILDSLNISIDDIRRRNRKPSEQLRETVNLFFKLTEDAPDVMRFLLLQKSEEFLPEEKPLMETPAMIKIHKIFQAAAKEGEIRNVDPLLAYTYFFGIVNHTLVMILSGKLNRNACSYQNSTWTTAWNTIAKPQSKEGSTA